MTATIGKEWKRRRNRGLRYGKYGQRELRANKTFDLITRILSMKSYSNCVVYCEYKALSLQLCLIKEYWNDDSRGSVADIGTISSLVFANPRNITHKTLTRTPYSDSQPFC